MLRLALVTCLLAVAGFARAEDAPPKRSWTQEKCFRYQRDWGEALRRFGRPGLSAEFVVANEAFIGSGCLSLDKICPRSARERELVDVLAMRVVSEGMSTTFLPFDCP